VYIYIYNNIARGEHLNVERVKCVCLQVRRVKFVVRVYIYICTYVVESTRRERDFNEAGAE